MMMAEVSKSYPKVEREYALPADRARSLASRVRRSEAITQIVPELLAQLFEDAEMVAEEAWEEIAKIGGFESLDDAHRQGFVLAICAGVVQVRSKGEE